MSAVVSTMTLLSFAAVAQASSGSDTSPPAGSSSSVEPIAPIAPIPTIQVIASARTAADISVETFFQRPSFSDMSLSPNGRRLVGITSIRGHDNLAMIDLDTRKSTILTSITHSDVWSYRWVSNDRLYFEVADKYEASGEIRLRGRYAVDLDGKNLRDLLYPTERAKSLTGNARDSIDLTGPPAFEILTRASDGSEDLIVMMNTRSRFVLDVYQFDTRTGVAKLLTHDGPGNVMHWVLDHDRVPRIAVRREAREDPKLPQLATLWHRASLNDKWQKVATLGDARRTDFWPTAFDSDNKTLIVSARADGDREALYKYDLSSAKLGELLIGHPLVDIGGGLITNRARRAVLGVRYSAGQRGVAWFDEKMAALQLRIDKALPGLLNSIHVTDDASRYILIHSYSDRDAGTYYLFDTEKGALERITRTRAWLPPQLMSERKFIRYKARDGRMIPAWVTLPNDSNGKNLPLIVHIHGGPWIRAYHSPQWGSQPIAQFFASRGYAVLEPEPRGSSGFGLEHLNAGKKQLGLAMQDDITDGALHLINEGIVDKSRMCLFGASYGGYAALQGVVKDPDLWRCTSAYVAVTDLTLWQTTRYSDTARLSDFLETDFKLWVGDYIADKAQFEKTSPARNADKIKAAVMLTMGSDDQRVPLVHGEAMRDAMRAAGKPIDYHVYQGEAHGFNKPENVIDFYKRNERFFESHLRPRSGKTAAESSADSKK